MERRDLIRLIASGGLGASAGCVGLGGPSTPTASEGSATASDDPRGSPTASFPASVTFGFPIPVVSVLNSPVVPGLDRTIERDATAIETELYRSSTNLVSGLLADEIDVGYVSLLSLINARNEGFPVVSVLGNFVELPFPLVASPGIDGWEALRGKRVAVNARVSITAAAVKLMATEELGSAEAIDLVQIPANPNRISALESGQVDAIAIAVNGAVAAEAQGIGRILARPWDYERLQDVLNALWIVTESRLDRHPSRYRSVVRSLRAAYAWCYRTAPEDVVDLALESGALTTGYDRQVQVDTVRLLQEMGFWPTGEGSPRRSLEKFVDVLVAAGMLPADNRPTYDALVDARFV